MKMKRLASGGLVLALVVPGVANAEQRISNLILGKVGMGTGEHLTVDCNGDGLIKFAVDGKILHQVTVVNKTGLIEAKRLVKRDGVILLADDPIPNTNAIVWQANLDQRRGAAGTALPTEQITREKTQELAFQYAARDLPELKASQ